MIYQDLEEHRAHTGGKQRDRLISSNDHSGHGVPVEDGELVVLLKNHVDKGALWRNN